MIDEAEVRELLRCRNGLIFHRESQTLEFKEQYNFSGLADYFRDFAAFANNRGGHLIFGVTDTPRRPSGLSDKSIDSFEKIDPERITGYLNEIFSSEIIWDKLIIEIGNKKFGVFKVLPSERKPVIARKDEGRENTLRNGDIYYRYGGRTQRIQSAELEKIINARIERTNRDWIEHVNSIGISGPASAYLLKSEKELAAKDKPNLVIDEELAGKLKFLKEGEFKEKDGATALRLVGDVVPVDAVEVRRFVDRNITERYPYSAKEVAALVKRRLPQVKQNAIWKAIEDNGLKGDAAYSAYNFRNRKQEEQYQKNGFVSAATPVIYNVDAVEVIVKTLDPK